MVAVAPPKHVLLVRRFTNFKPSARIPDTVPAVPFPFVVISPAIDKISVFLHKSVFSPHHEPSFKVRSIPRPPGPVVQVSAAYIPIIRQNTDVSRTTGDIYSRSKIMSCVQHGEIPIHIQRTQAT